MADALIESGVLSKKFGGAEQEYFVEDHIFENVGGRSYRNTWNQRRYHMKTSSITGQLAINH